MRHPVVVACLSLCGTGAIPAFGQEAPPPIIVTGRGLSDIPATPAYSTTEIGRDDLVSTASGRVEDALASVAGLQQFRRSDSRSANPSAQGVTLRGLGGNATSRTLVLLDGVPMTDPLFGYVPFSAIDPAQLKRVQVMRGGGSGAFGAGAVAGTLELESAGADDLGLLSGEFASDNRGETELSGALAPHLGAGYAVLSGRWDRGQGFWTTPASQRSPASARARYESWSAGARAAAPLGPDVELQFRGLAFEDHRTLRFRGADSRSEGQDASVRLVGRGAWQFDVLGYVQARDFGNIVISSTTFRKTLDQRSTPSTGLGGKLEVRPPVGSDHVLRIGSDIRLSRGTLDEDAYSGVTGAVTARRTAGGRNVDLGFFIEDSWTTGPLVLSAGARADRWTIRGGFFRETAPSGAIRSDLAFADRSGWDGSFRAGGILSLGHGIALRASGYGGIRLPTINELYRPFVVFPVTTQANAGLANERLRGYEAGIDITSGNAKLSLTAFDNEVRHAIANVTIGPNLRQRRNVDAVRSRGIEASGSLQWRTLTLRGSLALTDARVEASGPSVALDGKRPAQTPEVSAYLGVDWRPAPGWLLAADVRHTGMQYEDDLGTDRLPAATTVNAVVEVPVPGATLFLRGENLGDAQVVTRNQAGSLDLGAPRTLWAGLKFRFQGK